MFAEHSIVFSPGVNVCVSSILYVTGLANRVVPNGKALDVALEMANQIAAFPQTSLLADRQSVHYSMFGSSSFVDALMHEASDGSEAAAEAIEGARRFADGEGRSGAF